MKYIVDFDTKSNQNQERDYSLSGTNKARYIANTISAVLCEPVEIISPALTKKTKGIVTRKKYFLSDGVSVELFGTFGCKFKVLKIIRFALMQFRLFLYLLFSTRNNERILVYHEMKFSSLILLAKRIKKIHLILEVEEIYSDVHKYSKRQVKNEYNIIRAADMYLFASELLRDRFSDDKPSIVIYGAYESNNMRVDRSNDCKTHLVYSGTFDKAKGGVYTAIKCARYLDNNFVIHILGFGTNDDVNYVTRMIDDENKKNKCTILYEGKKEGNEYLSCLKKCDIGLSTQNAEGIYNLTSFPSKILTYLSCNLRVITVDLDVIRKSAISENVYYYNPDCMESLIDVIKYVSSIEINGMNIISELDTKFAIDINNMLGNGK